MPICEARGFYCQFAETQMQPLWLQTGEMLAVTSVSPSANILADEAHKKRKHPTAESVLESLELLSPEERSTVVSRISVLQESFSGPMPHPNILKGYEEVLPGAAERILQMAENEQQHRHKQEDRICKGSVSQVKRGQWIALFVVVMLTAVATALTLLGQQTVGGIIFGTTIAAVTTIFIVSKNRDKKDSIEE